MNRNVLADKDVLQRQLEILKKDLENKTRDLDVYRKKLEENYMERENNARLKAEIENLYDLQRTSYKQIEELKTQNAWKDEEINKLELAVETLKPAKASQQELETQIKELKNSIEIKDKQINSLKETSNSLVSEMSEIKETLEEKDNEIKALKEKVKKKLHSVLKHFRLKN